MVKRWVRPTPATSRPASSGPARWANWPDVEMKALAEVRAVGGYQVRDHGVAGGVEQGGKAGHREGDKAHDNRRGPPAQQKPHQGQHHHHPGRVGEYHDAPAVEPVHQYTGQQAEKHRRQVSAECHQGCGGLGAGKLQDQPGQG